MCKNCRTYNGEDNIYFDCALNVEATFDALAKRATETST